MNRIWYYWFLFSCRFQKRHLKLGSSYGGCRRLESSMRDDATGWFLLREVSESPPTVGGCGRHHTAPEHVHHAPGHSAGEPSSCFQGFPELNVVTAEPASFFLHFSSSWSWSQSCWPQRRPCRCISPSRTRSCCLSTIRRRCRLPRRSLHQRLKVPQQTSFSVLV